MSIKPLIQELQHTAEGLDAHDLPTLGTLQEQLVAIKTEFESENQDAADAVAQATDVVEQIMLRELDDTQTAIQFIADTINYLGNVIDSVEAGDPASVRAPVMGKPESNQQNESRPLPDDIDSELVSAWVSQCEHTFPELEGIVLSLEENQSDSEVLGDVRRRVHTIKGECGILSLDVASTICHEAESAIDRCLDLNKRFPVDDLLHLIDWLKRYIFLYANDPTKHHQPPEYDSLLNAFKQYATEEIDADNQQSTIADTPPRSPSDRPDSDAGLVTFDLDPLSDENLDDFIAEARDHLLNTEAALLGLEDNTTSPELLESSLQNFNRISACAGFLNVAPVVQLTRSAESLLENTQQGTCTLTQASTTLLLETCDMISKLLNALESQDQPPQQIELETLEASLAAAAQGNEIPETLPQNPQQVQQLGTILCEDGLITTEQLDQALATQKTISDDSDDQSSGTKKIGQILGLDPPSLVEPLRLQREQKRQATQELPETPQQSPTPVAQPPATADTKATTKPAPNSSAPSNPTASANLKNRQNQTVKVNTTRMDGLVDMVGELVIAHQMVVQDECVLSLNEQRTQRNLTHVGKIIRDLQEVAMSLRMVTVKSTFQRMARLVRDLASKSEKNIRFVVEGEDTELDRTVVEEIADPLIHMIRNACDHGLESPAERRDAGKPEAGQITLRAFHQGGSIIIEVQDDGRGLNKERIFEKAVEKGLLPPDKDPQELSDSFIYNTIFSAGFSTASEVTDVSGRGVGLDVVRRNIEALRGKAEIHSTPGEGSTFVLRLPLTMAIIDGMIVRVGSQRYVIPTLAIEQSYRPKPSEIHTVVGRGEMAQVRGSLLPIYRLNKVFGLSEGLDDLQEALLLVLEANNSRCGLVVDEILGQQQVVIKSLGQGVNSIRGVSGGAILGDGRVAPIIDVAGLVNEATRLQAA